MRKHHYYVLLAAAIPVFTLSAKVPAHITEQVEQSVMLVQARSCNGSTPARNGTGFAWLDAKHVVTAWHVVGGCSSIELWYENAPGQPFATAKLARVLKRNDLALLIVNAPPTKNSLSQTSPGNPDSDYQALGYGLGMLSIGEQDVRMGVAGSSVLGQWLPIANTQSLSGTDIDTQQSVIRFSSQLLPGMSGGPVYDDQGRVIAIVAGGLKNGTVPASWGWPATLLNDLAQSNEPLNGSVSLSNSTYAFVTNPVSSVTVTCGGLTFNKGNTVTFEEAAKTSDDVNRLYSTASVSAVPINVLQGFRFQLWTHLESGATLAVPDDVTLTQQGNVCVAATTNGTFEQVISASPAANQHEVNQASITFEQQIVTPKISPNLGSYPDQVLTTWGPQQRSDGLVVNRKAYFFGRQQLGPGRFKATHQFETLMARDGTFVGISTFNNDVEQCVTPVGQYVLCHSSPQYLQQWAKFVLATQMSTYPVH
ncbi:serine protease [Citrobacter sp. BDA59-3]|uniref:S1 family peptidase n=1 Tax=Citrobacter sp. BDA59-3 TaxID=2781952 RepID=UPI001882E644|nr:serine protease [Citrobacter sp. BDA59-3]QOV66933.1 trypsin-like peptidase domain-containing protein [Citrobacter sp. BDA59-3]